MSPEVESVVAVVRAFAPRPKSPPRTAVRVAGFLRFEGGKTPLGLLPGAKYDCPIYGRDIPFRYGLKRVEIDAFNAWWDALTMPNAAVEAVWGAA